MKKILEIKNLSKKYGANHALKDVDLDIGYGEVHGLVGLNGSGKSTLMNILFAKNSIEETGGYSGSIYFDQDEYLPKSSHQALTKGIGMIHQEFALFDEMTVFENIKLRRENTFKSTDRIFSKEYSLLDKKKDIWDSVKSLEILGIETDVREKTMKLSTSMKQFSEIAREIENSQLKLLLLDEPTAVLSEDEAKKLLDFIRNLSKKGVSVLFVSHRLEEILDVCDKVTVLRDGALVSSCPANQTNIDRLTYEMVGKSVKKTASKGIKKNLCDPILKLKDFKVGMKGEEIGGIDLDVFKGEILGVTSLSGHGKLALGYGLMGLHKPSGQVEYKNRNYDLHDHASNIKNGMLFLSDERKISGLLLNKSVEYNTTFTADQIDGSFSKRFFGLKIGIADKKKCRETTESFIRDFDIKCSTKDQAVGELSGGNQQKVALARAMAANPDLLLISEPTRGIDVSAKEKVLSLIKDTNEKKDTTFIIASSEIDDLRKICDRIAVLYEGRISAMLGPDDQALMFSYALSGISPSSFKEAVNEN